jgi:hypothetical protein
MSARATYALRLVLAALVLSIACAWAPLATSGAVGLAFGHASTIAELRPVPVTEAAAAAARPTIELTIVLLAASCVGLMARRGLSVARLSSRPTHPAKLITRLRI